MVAHCLTVVHFLFLCVSYTTVISLSWTNHSQAIGCGEYHALLVTRSESDVFACGLNSYGQLGLGDTDNRKRLTLVDDLTVSTRDTRNIYAIIARAGFASAWILPLWSILRVLGFVKGGGNVVRVTLLSPCLPRRISGYNDPIV